MNMIKVTQKDGGAAYIDAETIQAVVSIGEATTRIYTTIKQNNGTLDVSNSPDEVFKMMVSCGCASKWSNSQRRASKAPITRPAQAE